ncbi:hypothetical protein NH340_JMT06976 [Sarcoptes scabiei]|nr:hypothetical protein NH340_JMT06976 [Sarcoptes scabiei]
MSLFLIFTFDHCFWSFDPSDGHYASQEDVFQQLGVSVLDSAFQGYNACIFAYGQTGSGKSYTMMGTQQEKGLIPRLCDAIFERIKRLSNKDSNSSFKLEVSYMEIYNEKVHDLLDPGGARQNLKVREHSILGPYVDGLSTLAVSSFEEINSLMAEGNKSRTVASTNMNSESSRSHAVFTLKLTCSNYDPIANVVGEKVSKMSLVDLAGSERAIKTGAVGDRLKEGSNINRSLTTLGLVISKLADQASGRNRKDQFVPYRDSVLTWLLKDNLGGNSKTIMISTISPSADSYEETLSTLRYADRAKRIVNHAIINEDPNNRIIRELREEVEQLREQLLHANVQSDLRERLAESEKLIKDMEQTWEEKLRKTEKIHQERQQALEKMGISVQSSGIAVEKDRYYLVNLNADPSMNALLVYYLKDRTLIGRPDTLPVQDIQLSGVGIMPEHAIIEIDREQNQIYMQPINDARTFVNGLMIHERCRLHNGDRILWGNNHFFSINCPVSIDDTNRFNRNDEQNFFDYNYARNEILSSNYPDLKSILSRETESPSPIRGLLIRNDGLLSGSTTYLPLPNQLTSKSMNSGGLYHQRAQIGSSLSSSSSSASSSNISPSLLQQSQRILDRLVHKRQENFRLYLSKLREEIIKANTSAFEANLIAEEMRKQTEFKVTLQIPATNLNLNRLKQNVNISEPAILVKRKNFIPQIWSMEKFEMNLIEMRERYNEWKERQNLQRESSVESNRSCSSLSTSTTSRSDSIIGTDLSSSTQSSQSYGIQIKNDPFYELQERHLLIGVANIFLEVLMQNIVLDYHVPIISQQGEIVGRLHIEFGRIEGDFGERIADAGVSDIDTDDAGSNDGIEFLDSTNGSTNNQSVIVTDSSRSPLGFNQIRVRLRIKNAHGLPSETSNFVFCQYTFCGMTDVIVITPIDATDCYEGKLNHLAFPSHSEIQIIFNHQKEFVVNLTEEFREICTDGALSIEVWGHRISANPILKNESDERISSISRTLTDRWLELKRRIEFWIEIHELNDQGTYSPVDIEQQSDIATGGIYQLRQGQQRRILVQVETVPDSGTLPIICDQIYSVQIGCVCARSRAQKPLDSYQEGDLSILHDRWSNVLQKRQSYLHDQINELINKNENKTHEDIEREHRLMKQWVNLVEERKASKCPLPGSEIPGATNESWEPPIGMENHIPIIFLDLDADDVTLSNKVSNLSIDVAGANSILPKEYNGTAFYNLSMVSAQTFLNGLQCVAVWDSSVHESQHLNRPTAANERIYLIVKIGIHLSHPSKMDLILRKRIAINVYKKQGLVSSTKNIFKKISRLDVAPNATGITYEIVSSIPKQSEDFEDRESLALMAASDIDLTACDGESYIERYTKSVSALESILTLERLRQEVAVREQLSKKAKKTLRFVTNDRNGSNQSNPLAGLIGEGSELRKALSVPNMAQLIRPYRPLTTFEPFDSEPTTVASETSEKNAIEKNSIKNITNGGGGGVVGYQNRQSSTFDLSYVTTAAQKLRTKASSFLGSMTGLNQIYLTEIDIGESVKSK